MISRLIAPLSLLRSGARQHFNFLQQATRSSISELDLAQRQRLVALLKHAGASVPAYSASRWTLDASLPEILSQLPLLTKTDLRYRFAEHVSNDIDSRRWYYNNSGGSTGSPVRFIQDRGYAAWSRALTYLFETWAGYTLGAPKAVLWGAPSDLPSARPGIKRLASSFKKTLKNEYWLNSYSMSKEDVRKFLSTLSVRKPSLLLGYAESLFELARFGMGHKIQPPRLGSIMSTAGTLLPHMRITIESYFGCSVFDRYGSREMSAVASQCREGGGLHFSPLTHIVEVLDEDGQPLPTGSSGELVLTSLVNYSMPMLRYRTGDIASVKTEACSCGLAWPCISPVEGRIADYFVGEWGKLVRVPAAWFTEVPWLEKYRVIQEAPEVIRVHLQVSDSCSHEDFTLFCNSIGRSLEALLGGKLNMSFERVTTIPPTPSGKHRPLISYVAR